MDSAETPIRKHRLETFITATASTLMNSTPPSTNKTSAQIAPRTAVLVACVLTLLFTGVIHGELDGRWSNQDDLEAHGSLLAGAPTTVGDWQMVSDEPLSSAEADMLQCYGSVTRYYRNRNSGHEVGLLLLYGPRGPVAVHVPEVCYSSIGTTPHRSPVTKTIPDKGREDTFWMTQFRQATNPTPSFEVWYGWSNGDVWEAAKHPRFWPTKHLYKIQVSGPIAREGDAKSPPQLFLEQFIPTLRNGIVPAPK